jgi:hypothetical protein
MTTDATGARVTNQGDATAGEELWTPGEAAAYLNAGAINLGFNPRRITDMIKRGELSAIQTHVNGWRRTPATGIRRLRAELLRDLGVTDPDFPLSDDVAQAGAADQFQDDQDPDQDSSPAG